MLAELSSYEVVVIICLYYTPAGDKLLEEICSFQADFVFCAEYLFVCTFKQQSKATVMFSGILSFR